MPIHSPIRCSRPPSSSTRASRGSHNRRPRTKPGGLVPALKCDHQRAEQPVAAAHRRLTRTTYPAKISRARVKCRLAFGACHESYSCARQSNALDRQPNSKGES